VHLIINHQIVDRDMITIDQIRAGRAMARLTQAQLAAQAGISTTAMNNIEHGTDAKGSTLRAIQAALEKVGIEFDADGRGVRLKPAQVSRDSL
jgi:DNA-binding XRE family transcriptional regulator